MADNDPHPASQQSWVPRPDPTTLTTEQLRREIGSLRELIEHEIQTLVVRIDGFERHVDDMKSFNTERIRNVEKRMDEEREHRKESERNVKDTVAAALAAHRELTEGQNRNFMESLAKGEAATTKQIDSLQVLMRGSNESLNELMRRGAEGVNDKISSLQSRIDRGEGKDTGASDYSSRWLAVAAIIIAALTMLATAFAALHPGVPTVSAPNADFTLTPTPSHK